MKIAPVLISISCLCLSTFGSGIAHRQSNLEVRVVDAANQPIANAEIHIEMLNHSFRWGTAIDAFEIISDSFQPAIDEGSTYDPVSVEKIQEFCNSVTFGNRMKWKYFENYRDNYPNLNAPVKMVQYAKNLKAFNKTQPFRIRGHSTLWQAAYQIPDDVRYSNDPDHVRARIHQHIADYHEYFAGHVTVFDLMNEPFHETLLSDKLYTEELADERINEWVKWFQIAHEKDPNAKLYMNEYNVLNDWNWDLAQIHDYKALIDTMRDRGAPIHGIGLQAHVDRYLSQQSVRKRLDILAAPMAPTEAHPEGLPGLPIEITELDIGEDNVDGNRWYGRCESPDDRLQAEMFENIIVAAFEHPSVEGLTVWGMSDNKHWRKNGPFFDDTDPSNWTPKPALATWIEYVTGNWWTDLIVNTTETGSVIQNVIKGDYLITVTHPNADSNGNPVVKTHTAVVTEDSVINFQF